MVRILVNIGLEEMKKIGIIGGLSSESTIEYYRLLVQQYNKIKGGLSSPDIIIDSLDLETLTNQMQNENYPGMLANLKQAAKNLVAGGAEVVIMATNTPHIVFEDLQKCTSVPMISIMDATAHKILEMKINKIGLLGTRFTMQTGYYHKALKKFSIEVIVPELEDQKLIDKIIYEELVYHTITEESKKTYLKIIGNLQKSGAQGVILGCTEIPLLVKQEDSPIPVFDTATNHALAVLKFALSDEEKLE